MDFLDLQHLVKFKAEVMKEEHVKRLSKTRYALGIFCRRTVFTCMVRTRWQDTSEKIILLSFLFCLLWKFFSSCCVLCVNEVVGLRMGSLR